MIYQNHRAAIFVQISISLSALKVCFVIDEYQSSISASKIDSRDHVVQIKICHPT